MALLTWPLGDVALITSRGPLGRLIDGAALLAVQEAECAADVTPMRPWAPRLADGATSARPLGHRWRGHSGAMDEAIRA